MPAWCTCLTSTIRRHSVGLVAGPDRLNTSTVNEGAKESGVIESAFDTLGYGYC